MKPKFVKSRVYIMIRGKVAVITRQRKIRVINNNEGVLMDGRPVKFINGIWVYEAIP